MLHLGSTYLIVKDMQTSIDFYEKLLQRKPTAKIFDRFVQFDFEGQCVALFCNDYDSRMMETNTDLEQQYNAAYLSFFQQRQITYGNNVVLNFWIEDLMEEYSRIIVSGIGGVSEILYVNIARPYYFFNVTNPDGNTIEITGEIQSPK